MGLPTSPLQIRQKHIHGSNADSTRCTGSKTMLIPINALVSTAACKPSGSSVREGRPGGKSTVRWLCSPVTTSFYTSRRVWRHQRQVPRRIGAAPALIVCRLQRGPRRVRHHSPRVAPARAHRPSTLTGTGHTKQQVLLEAEPGAYFALVVHLLCTCSTCSSCSKSAPDT